MNEEAQLMTLEGFTAATLMMLTVLLIIRSSLIITPQSELSIDVQLEQTASDVLAVLDMAPETASPMNLTGYVAGWNMSEATLQSNSLPEFDYQLSELLGDMMYNVEFAYVENGTLTVKHVILHGAPVENSAVATRLVTLYNTTVSGAGGAWNISSDDLKVVEVRLTPWRV